MTEVLFYHLQRQPLEAVLPTLLERSLDRGWRVAVQGTSADRLEALDDRLWTYRDDSFLPHALDGGEDAAEEAVLLTLAQANSNGATVRFLVDGADLPEETEGYERIVILFDGNDDEALARARSQWKTVKSRGLGATYWQQDDGGRWEKKA